MIGIETVASDLKEDEGLRLNPYKCPAGKITIGYGRNIEDNGITEDEAELLLVNDIKSAYRDLIANFCWFESIPSKKQEVILNMCFNLGINRLMRFKRMVACLEKNDYMGAAKEMKDSRWYNQVGPRARRLVSLMSDGKIT